MSVRRNIIFELSLKIRNDFTAIGTYLNNNNTNLDLGKVFFANRI